MKLKSGLLFLALFSFMACSGPEGEDSVITKMLTDTTLPPANGGILDVLVVCDDAMWQGDVGSALEEHFIGMVYGLPQPEPRFTLRQVNNEEFSDLLQRSRYIFLVSAETDSAEFLYEKDKWARGQLVVHMSAADEVSLSRAIKSSRKAIGDRIESLERDRLMAKITPLTLKEYPEFFNKHGLKLEIPKDFGVSVAEEDVVVYWKTTTRSDNGLLIYVGDLPAEGSIIGNEIIPLRDSLTKLYVPGEREGSHMVTETLIKPQFNTIEFEGHFAIEARGLWRTVGDIMGGPFVSYTIYDEEKGRMIYIESFILAPQKKKRKSLFELEALVRSLELL
ncbi:MAG: DUF4837 family protein [Croceimicrobium sp.]